MRRAATILATAVAIGGPAWLALGAGESTGAGYRIDVIFDNVFGVVEGQDVRVAGATVGTVDGLSVTADNRARVRMTVDRRFAPFRSDASCTIQPQSLIGEKFVQCTPGTSAGAPLPADDGVPTVPVGNTTAPVDLSLVLGTFDRPARERLAILLGSLGAGLAGRGEDLNATIRRAAPALQETNRVLRVLDADRARLRQLADDGDAVLAQLARRGDRVAAFVRETSRVAETAAQRRERLAEAVRRLPGLLGEARPALDRLAEFTREATPLARELRAGAPDLDTLLRDTSTFADRAGPTLRALSPTLTTLRQALPAVAPQTRRLGRFAERALPAANLLEDLLTSSRENGVIEGLAGFFYYTAAAVSRFDKYGHYLPAYQLASSGCGLYATTPVAGCSAKLGVGAATRTGGSRPAKRTRRPSRPGTTPTVPTPATPVSPQLPGLPSLGDLTDPQQLPKELRELLGPLLGTSRDEADQADSLLGYLLG
jgi:virulence factor Mce-like protein